VIKFVTGNVLQIFFLMQIETQMKKAVEKRVNAFYDDLLKKFETNITQKVIYH